MLKFYLSTVLIYFMVYITSGILFRKQFIIARDKLRKAMNDNSKTYGVVKTLIAYLLISFIPIIRFLSLAGKYYLVFNTYDYIKTTMERNKKNEDR